MLTESIAALQSALDALLEVDLVGVEPAELTAAMQGYERVRRQMSVGDHCFVAELVDRKLAAEQCQPNASIFLQQLLRLTPAEAAGRVRAAADLGPRRSLLGEVLAPLFGRVAAAQAAGVISPAHARVIVDTVEKIPHAVQAEFEGQVEAQLVELAASVDPGVLAKAGLRVLAYLDPDGVLTDDADHQRRREFRLLKNRDGSAQTPSYLAPDLTAIIEAYLDVYAAPQPAADGVRDLRTVGQRNYDAIAAGFTHLMTCGPSSPDGKPAKPAGTLILTTTTETFTSGQGYVTTPHGDLISVPTALSLVDPDNTMGVLFTPTGGIMSYGRLKRLVPPDMRLALTARDRGCSFPGCTNPAAWSDAHHFQAWADGGETSTENTGLVCTWHHDHFQQKGWRSDITNGRPHWTPPKMIDPAQIPRRNTVHGAPLRT